MAEYQVPLTWDEARRRLRCTLELWKSGRTRRSSLLRGESDAGSNVGGKCDQSAKNDVSTGGATGAASGSGRGATDARAKWWRVDDPDMIFLAIPLSLALVVLSFVLPPSPQFDNHQLDGAVEEGEHHHYEQSRQRNLGQQRAGALLFLIASLASAWITRRRRVVSRDTDRSIERRRCVSAFLRGMNDWQQGKSKPDDSTTPEQKTPGDAERDALLRDMVNVDIIPRKNVEDVYSTYRLVGNQQVDEEGGGNGPQSSALGHWHRIPTLLLVKGDFVALKVGDTAPARCQLVVTMASDNNNGDSNATFIEAGERLTIESLSPAIQQTFGSHASDSAVNASGPAPTSNSKDSKRGCSKKHEATPQPSLLPTGRSTLKYHSKEMLLLANAVQIFVLLDTPLDSFLRKDDGADIDADEGQRRDSTPQIVSRGQAIRGLLLPLSIVAFAITTFILLVRPGGPAYFFSQYSTYHWTLPLLASLSVLPVTTPLLLFWVECIGTSRILATVHPITTNRKGGAERASTAATASSPAVENFRRTNSTGSVFSITSEENVLGGMSTMGKPSPRLLLQYLMATTSSRLFNKSILRRLQSLLRSSHRHRSQDALLSIPPASLHLLEKLGVVTALAVVDDELACEPYSTPQQLLIPSAEGGFSLLDICPVMEEEDSHSSEHGDNGIKSRDQQDSDLASVDSDDSIVEARFNHSFSAPVRTLRKIRRNYRKKRHTSSGGRRVRFQHCESHREEDEDDIGDIEVEFEDPNWWKHLPSLKCIGLGCLLVEDRTNENQTLVSQRSSSQPNSTQKVSFDVGKPGQTKAANSLTPAEISLIDHICCNQRERKQLSLLAQCIGFDMNPHSLTGPRGDISSFHERRRLHIMSTDLLRQRMQLNSHALGLEESRNWSRLFTDADTVFVRDKRSGGDLLLTVGDARIVTQLCPDWWQGENSTISPLTAADRQIINETQKNWMLSDMDVQAFSYAPLPYTADQKIEWGGTANHIYLLDNTATPNAHVPSHGFWSLVRSQIFLGMLGSSVRPRKEIEPLIVGCADAGVRFVYFSPRNMRRTKELAAQMGIDVAWNCAISLRPLQKGTDEFRMIGYEDWDVNARLPHGVDDVKRHLKEVDNVPLLVSLYTDVTKKTAADMVDVFQEYKDTVLSIGLSHLPGNQGIFSRAELAIGVDVLSSDFPSGDIDPSLNSRNALTPDEIAFVTSISAHSSIFNLSGHKATRHIIEIIRIGRACLEAATSSASFTLSSHLSFCIFILLCPCTAATVVPSIPLIGCFLCTQVLVPSIGLTLALSDDAKEFMTRVPPKNDPVKYSLVPDYRHCISGLLRVALPAALPQFLYLIVLGQLMWELEPSFVLDFCLHSIDGGEIIEPIKPPTASILRCNALRDYSGPVTESGGTILLASFALCICVSSASYVFRTESIRAEPPWKRNHLWLGSLAVSFILVAGYLSLFLENGSMQALGWSFYLLFVISPFICLYCCEVAKKMDQTNERRAAMMRRLQFETRLGMWSPKESTHVGA